MARKKTSGTNKVVPIVVLAAILGGGYYLYTSDNSSDSQLSMPGEGVSDELVQPVQNEVQAGDSMAIDSVALVDTIAVANAITDEAVGNASKNDSKATAKNAYVDEYGNVIYTQPNGVAPIKYKTAMMGRWGYSVKYPSFLTKPSHGSDGSSFEDGKGRKLATYATWNVFNESISELYRKEFPDVKTVTYKKLFRKEKTYVKSGYTKDNRIFYLKEAIFEKDEQEVVATLIYFYPKSDSKQADKVIKEIFGSFPKKK